MEYYEHNPGDHEDPVSGPTWLMGLVGTILLVVIIFGLTALYYNAYARQLEMQVVDRDPYELREYREEQQALLAGETRPDADAQRDVISIEQAMQRMAQQASSTQ